MKISFGEVNTEGERFPQLWFSFGENRVILDAPTASRLGQTLADAARATVNYREDGLRPMVFECEVDVA